MFLSLSLLFVFLLMSKIYIKTLKRLDFSTCGHKEKRATKKEQKEGRGKDRKKDKGKKKEKEKEGEGEGGRERPG